MSYLVDALRKAEHERHRDRATDMTSLSSAMPWPRRAGGRSTRWIVGVLVVCNLALLLYLLLPRALDSGTAVAQAAVAPPADVAAAAPAPPEPDATASATGSPATPEPEPTRQADIPYTRGPQLANRQRASAPERRELREPRWASVRRRDSYVPAAPMPAPADVPEITINGHLYSADPSKSFILVGGRIYHEGERLSAGPAVVRIDDTGAVLNYRGRRYHVDGPG